MIHHSECFARVMRLSARSDKSMPPMKYISPLIQVGYMFQQTLVPRGIDGSIRMMEHHSVPLVRVMAFDFELITCGTLSSPSEGVSPTTSVFH